MKTRILTSRWIAHALRGGVIAWAAAACGADEPSDTVEQATLASDLSLESATLDDTLGTCDSDNIMDRGEYGKLTVTLRNSGINTLSATTATISSTSSDVWFPSGTTIAFPRSTPGNTTTASLRIAYLGTVVGIQQVDLQIDFSDPQDSGVPQTRSVGFRTNTDEIVDSSSTDTVEPAAPPWIPAFNPSLGDVAPWSRIEITPLQHRWHVDDPDAGSDQYLISPVMTVDGSGTFNLQFDHAWSFDAGLGGNIDGGVVEVSINGGPFVDLDTSGYNGTLVSYIGDVNPLRGRDAFVASSGGALHSSLTRAIAPGSAVQVRFRAGSDLSGAAPGWDIDNIAFAGVVETPFATLVAETSPCSAAPTQADLAITVTDGVTSATAGGTVTYTITAINASGDAIIGASVADTFPADLTCSWTCVGSGGGSCVAAGAGNISQLVDLPLTGAVTFTATCALSPSTSASQLVNTATVALPGPVTDPDPSNNSATDVDTVIRLPALLVASKTVAGAFTDGSPVTYTIELHNDGAGAQLDNAGNELADVLPATLTLVTASANSGTTVAALLTNTVTWNGSINAGATVTITIVATINAVAGTRISNQAVFSYDSQGTGINDATGTTDAVPCTGP